MTDYGSVLARAVVVLEGDDEELKKMLSNAEDSMVKAGEKMSEIGHELMHKVTLPLAGLAALSVHAWGAQQDAIARVDGVLRASGNAAGITSEHMQHLAEQLQAVTRFSSTATDSAASMLLTFSNVRNVLGAGNDVFDRTVKLSQDLASLMGGDLQSAMFMLGRAMEDPANGLTMLQRRTHALTKEQIEQIKTLADQGKILDAQKVLLAALDARMGGLAQTMAQTDVGQFAQAWNEVETTLEGFGKILDRVLVPLAQQVRAVAIWFRGLSDGAKEAIAVIGAVTAAIGPLLIALGALIKAWGLLSTIFISTPAALAGVVGAVALAVASIATIAYVVVKDWLVIKQQTVALWAFIKDAFFHGADYILSLIEMLPNAFGNLSTVATSLRTHLGKAAAESAATSGRALADLELQIRQAGATAAAVAPAIADVVSPPPPTGPSALTDVQKTLRAFSAALSQAEAMQVLLGNQFDVTSAQAEAYDQVIKELVAEGVAFDQKVGPNGETLRQMAQRMMELKAATALTAAQQAAYNEQIQIAQQAVDATLTPMDQFNRIVAALQQAVTDGVITWDQYIAALAHAKLAMRDMQSMSEQLKQAIHDIAGRAVDDFVDFAFGAQKSFGDFVKNAIEDLSKLIIKIELMKLLFPKGGGGLFGGLFASGGFLSAGQIGIVGEAGPELIAAGSGGVSIKPMRSMQYGGHGESTRIELGGIHISAVDAQSFADLVESNPGAIAGPIMKMLTRSSALQQAMVR